jgi:hypothetical protein
MRALFALSLGIFACGTASQAPVLANSDTPQTTITTGCLNVAQGECCTSPGEVQVCQYHESSGSYTSCQPGSITCLASGFWGACEPTVDVPDSQALGDSSLDAVDGDSADGDAANSADSNQQ